MSKLYLVLLMTCFLSCINSKQKHWEGQVEETVSLWDKKKFTFPQNLKVFNNINNQLKRNNIKPYQIAVYVDGTCGVCIQDLVFWKDFIKENDLENSNCGFQMYIFAFDPDDFQKGGIEKLNISYPWLYDKKSDYVTLNKLDDKRFQAALIDTRTNKVVLIGNPVLNPQLAQLYANTVKNLNKKKNKI